jgi:hypothetical protein
MTRSIYFPQGRPSAGFLGSKSFFVGNISRKWVMHLHNSLVRGLTTTSDCPPSVVRRLGGGTSTTAAFTQVAV